MNHPTIASANGNERYNRLLKKAENFRRVKALAPAKPKPRFFQKLREAIAPPTQHDLGKTTGSPA
jgi:hypothetical protein